jgi:hypothetical protein
MGDLGGEIMNQTTPGQSAGGPVANFRAVGTLGQRRIQRVLIREQS